MSDALDDFEYTLTRRALRQIKAEAWAEGWHAYLQRKKLVDDNPYRDKPSKDGED